MGRSSSSSTSAFAAAIGLSAFLLFSVEPLVGKRLLPVFGGAPTVWTTTLCFFQIVLVAGYLYAHVSTRLLGRAGPIVHLGVAALGLVASLLVPKRLGDLRVGALPPALALLWILLVAFGPATVALTATTPLLTEWFRATRPGRDPYWLYAVSNTGSILALFAYPFVIEPELGLRVQRIAWLAAYGALLVALTVAAVARSRAPAPAAEPASTENAPPVTWSRRGSWLLLSAVPSGLLSAVSTFLSTDLVAAPLVWMGPLALYIGSFIVAFADRGRRAVSAAILAAPAMITLLWVLYGASSGPVLALLPIELGAFGVAVVAIHGLLARDRPEPARATEFYVVVAIGGALGSMFVALVAPRVFPDIWEYPILLVGALVALALRAGPRPRGQELGAILRELAARMGPYVVGAGILAVILVGDGARDRKLGLLSLVVGGLLLLLATRPWVLVAMTATALVIGAFGLRTGVAYRGRSFFGVSEVRRTRGGDVMTLFSGTTVHGSQWTDHEKRARPTSYFAVGSPIADVFSIALGRASKPDEAPRDADADADAPREVAVVGLGAGTLAAYAPEGVRMTFFEIDPVVVSVATNPTYFTYLSDAPVPPRVVQGDARLSLREEPDGQYALVVLDAFSSDVLPVHIVTLEGLGETLRTLTPDGVLAIQISNRFYDLWGPLAAALERLGVPPLHGERPGGAEDLALPSRWIAASRDPAKRDALVALGWERAAIDAEPFTDDYANLLARLRIRR